MEQKVRGSRLSYIDNLRALMIIFVVMLHTAVTYSGFGSWYYVENKSVDFVSTLFFGFFQSFTQAYFMSLLFLIAGYFAAGNLDAKGTGCFVAGRLFRLGIPVLIYIFLINPVCVMISHPEVNIADYYIQGILSFDFISWTGPLWFALALLIFTLVYVLTRKISNSINFYCKFEINIKNVLLLVFFITIAAFAIRTVFPIGTDVINLQFSFFSAYVIMFAVGIMSYRYGIIDRIDYNTGKRWFAASFVIGLPFWIFLMLFGGPAEGIFLINGGLNWQAFAYALWESFYCVTIIIGLIGIFKYRYNTQNSFQKFLSDNAFGVFVFHAPILIGISILFNQLALYPVLKFIFISIIAVSASFIFSYSIRRIGFLRKIFS
ncbi:acyltransferase family protein [Pelotomaculum propionicicum]|uniref:acyltransferase family protein n=1 Tax=Pelotomaculum propionicicum TaxID=258475 RepID=UPI003B7A0772